MGISSKDIAKINRDREITELVNKLLSFTNSIRTNNDENIKKFAEFWGKLSRGDAPEDKEYENLVFQNALDVPFAEENLEELLDAADILMALESFPTSHPKAFKRAMNYYERCLHRAMTISNKNMVLRVFDMAFNILISLHEHKEYDHQEGPPKDENIVEDNFSKKQKFKKVRE